MANIIEYSEKCQGFIDEELEAKSLTQWMVPPAEKIEYIGGKEIKIAQLTVGGLGNYDSSANGSKYPKGASKLAWVPYSMNMDRAVRFEVGRADPGDTNFIFTAENVTREFTSKQLVPEQDAYRFNRIYGALAAKDSAMVTAKKFSKSHILSQTSDFTGATLMAAISKAQLLAKEDSNSEINFVAFMAMGFEPMLHDFANNNHHSIQFGKTVSINGYSYHCALINELPVVFVPSKRLQTVVKINDGRTAGQESGGIVADTTSKQIAFMILSSDAPMAVGKIDSLKIFSADEVQEGDETTINYHLLYDCWVMENQLCTVTACVMNAGT